KHDECRPVCRKSRDIWRLANSVSTLIAARRHFALHPLSHEGVASFRADEKLRHDLGQPSGRGIYTMEESQTRSDLALWSNRGPGCRLVHGPVLCSLLPPVCP